MEGWKDVKGYEGLYEINKNLEVRNKRTGKYLRIWGDYYCLYKNGNKKIISAFNLAVKTF